MYWHDMFYVAYSAMIAKLWSIMKSSTSNIYGAVAIVRRSSQLAIVHNIRRRLLTLMTIHFLVTLIILSMWDVNTAMSNRESMGWKSSDETCSP